MKNNARMDVAAWSRLFSLYFWRLEYDFFVLKEQVVAAGKEGIERGLLNLQQNIDRIAGVMNGNVRNLRA